MSLGVLLQPIVSSQGLEEGPWGDLSLGRPGPISLRGLSWRGFVVAAGIYGEELVVVRGKEGTSHRESTNNNQEAQMGECWTFNLPRKQWTQRTNLPVAFRSNASGLVVQDHMYIFVFMDTELRTFRLDLNDSSKEWEERAPLKGMRMEASLASDHHRFIYVSGGKGLKDSSDSLSKQEPLSALARYDISNNTWEEDWSSMPTQRYSHSSVVLNDHLYILGGRNDRYDWTADNPNTMYMCNLNTNTWKEGPPLPGVSTDSVATAFEKYLITFSSVSKLAYVFNTSTMEWGVSTKYALARVQPRATLFEPNKLVLVGGMEGKGVEELQMAHLEALIQSATWELDMGQ